MTSSEKQGGVTLSDRHFQAVVDCLPSGVLIAEPAGRILHANPAAASLLGRTAVRLSQLHLADVLPELPLDGDEPGDDSVVQLQRPDGETLPVELAYTVLPGEHGPLSVLTLSDASPPARQKEQFLRTQQLEAVGRLAATVAHDFNNLLTVISYCGDELRDGLREEDPRRRQAEELASAADRAAELTDRLLRLGRLDSPLNSLTHVNTAVTEAAQVFHHLLGDGIEVELELDPSVPEVMLSSGPLQQVVLSLVANSADAMKGGGRLKVATRPARLDEDLPLAMSPESTLVLSVSDTGEGMGGETARRAYEAFFTTKGDPSHVGLGLSFVREIVAGCGGAMTVESVPGEGTTVSLFLSRQALGERPCPVPEQALAPKANTSVLVVEDEELVRRVTAAALKHGGFEVVVAGDADEALKIMRAGEHEIGLLVTDICLPGMSGVDLAASLREGMPFLPVLYLSGRPAAPELAAQLDGATSAFVQKPFRPAALISAVKTLGLTSQERATRDAPASVLVIDDEEQVRRVLCRMLEDAGYKASGVSNGLEGIEHVRAVSCDLVITDVVMPVQEGLETCRLLASEFPELPVIATSGAPSGSTYLRMADRFGARETLAKPLHREELIAAVQRVLA